MPLLIYLSAIIISDRVEAEAEVEADKDQTIIVYR
jgi:hypothetical protein